MRVNKDWLECYTCGGKLEKNTDGTYVCENCGNTYRNIEKAGAETPSQLVEQLNTAERERKLRHFDKALEIYESAIGQDDRNLLAYWGAFLSEYGIEYVQENGTYVPRIHLISRIPATKSAYLQKIYDLCGEEESAEYRKKATEIEQLRYRSYELSASQEKYDAFIFCGEDSIEKKAADQLFDALKKEGIRDFLPSKSIPKNAPSAEACIFAASESAATMFLVAGSEETLDGNEYIWGRFIAGEGKKIQVLHNGLDESRFPFRLRKTFQKRAPIDLNGKGWIEEAKAFAVRKKEKKSSSQSTKTVVTERIVMQDRKAEGLSEAMTMVLSNLTVGNTEAASRIVFELFARLHGEELIPVATLCTELAALSKCPPAERNQHIDSIQNVSAEIKKKYPSLTLSERGVYGEIADANLLIYLAKCFGAIKDRARQCFVLDMVDYHNIYNTKTVTELVQMLLANGRTEEVSEVMRGVSRLDGNALLIAYLRGDGGDSVQKQINLLAIADKLDMTPAVTDDLNAYLSDCEEEGVALAVVKIMNIHKIPLNVMGLGGALSGLKDAESVRAVLENYGKRPLLNVEVDKLVTLAANGGNEVANEVLKHLRYQSGISDLGTYNMQYILEHCDLEKIKIAFFNFNIDKRLASELLVGAIRGNGADRLATVKILIDKVSDLEIKYYEKMLLGGDPLKKEFMKLLAPKTGKYGDANRQIEAFLAGRDSDEDKREIFEMFGDFPFSRQSIELYLDILPEHYDETYVKYLYPYLEENPAEARRIFVRHCESLIGGYEEHLGKIFDCVRSFDETSIGRFVSEFKGSQEVKDALVPKVVEFADKPKKIETICKHVQCNLLQAYLFTLKEIAPKTEETIRYLQKKGMDATDKVFVNGKKMKFRDYLQLGELDKKTVDLIAAHIKL